MKKAIPVILVVCMLLLAAACGGEKQVTVADGLTQTPVTVKANANVQAILEAAGITLGEEDVVTPALNEKPNDGDTVTVDRLTEVKIVTDDGEKTVSIVGGTVADALKKAGVAPKADESLNVAEDTPLYALTGDIVVAKQITVSLTADGKTEEIKTTVMTVADFLAAQQVEYADTDRLTPAADETLADGAEIVLQRVEEKTETVKEEIPFETKQEYSSSLESGKTQTKQQGGNGEKEVTYKIVLVDGEEETREAVEENVLKEAVNAIVVVGTKSSAPEPQTGANGKEIVSKVAVPDCDGSGHGYYVITYADGSVDYVDY
jgi:uncharacterized protein YabE (DUF348 family)